MTPRESILAEVAAPRVLKILMIAPQFRPVLGGYERAAGRLSSALAARGHAVTVVTEQRSRSWAAVEQIAGLQIRRLVARKTADAQVEELLRLRAQARFDVPQALPERQLRTRHTQALVRAREALDLAVAAAPLEHRRRQMTYQLGENQP
jgi:hypothetical protein